MRKLLIILFLFIQSLTTIYSQKKEVDSLINLLNIYQENDSTQVNILNNLSTHYKSIDLEKSFSYASKAKHLSEQINYKKGLAYSLYNLGTYYWRSDKFDSALVLCNKSLAIFNELNLADGKIQCFNRIAVIHMFKGNYKESIENYFKSLEICEETGNINQIGKIYHNIGAIYSNLNDYRKALEFINKALEYKKQINNPISLGISLYSKGSYYLKLDSLDKALKYSKESLEHNLKINNNYSIGGTYQTLAEIYDRKSKFDSAFIYHKKGLEFSENYGNKRQVGNSHYLLGNHYILKGQYNKAINHGTIAFNIALANADKNNILYSYEILQKAYAGLKDFENAYKYLSSYLELRNELNKKESIRRLAIEEKDFEFKLKQQAIDFKQQTVLSKQKNIKNYFITAFFVTLIFVLLISYAFYQKAKSNKILKNANETRDKMFRLISHDFRSPLISISNTLQLIPELIKEEDYNSAINLSIKDEQSVSRVLSLIDNLINWTLSQNDTIPYNPDNYNLKDICNDITEIYKPVAEFKQIKLINQVTSDYNIYADKNILTTILRNLINNAIKFTPEKGEISIATEQQNGKIQIWIQDNGIGIEKDKLKSIFNIEKDKNLGTKGEKGNGLGLFFCKEFAKKNKGDIWVESEPGKGSVFYFTVPKYK